MAPAAMPTISDSRLTILASRSTNFILLSGIREGPPGPIPQRRNAIVGAKGAAGEIAGRRRLRLNQVI